MRQIRAGVGLGQVLKLIGAVVGLGLSCIRIYSMRASRVLVYVIGWSTVVFGINSTSNAVSKCK